MAAEWASKTLKQRAAVMMRFHQLVTEHAEELVELIMRENGKNLVEARGDLAKGLETVEWAISMPNMCTGRKLTVSSGVRLLTCDCHMTRRSRRSFGIYGILDWNFLNLHDFLLESLCDSNSLI